MVDTFDVNVLGRKLKLLNVVDEATADGGSFVAWLSCIHMHPMCARVIASVGSVGQDLFEL